MSEATLPAGTGNKKKMILFVLIGVLSVGAGIGGTWYYMKQQQEEGSEVTVEKKKKKKPTTFIKLESFTVNLQSDDREPHYLQVELSLKVNESDAVKIIEDKKPEVRNQILLLLSSKKPSEINTLESKQKLSEDIIQAVRSKIDSEELEDDILDVLFTSFIIQ